MTPGQHPLANRYSLIRQLAAGSYAETWLGTDGALDRYVAVKLLHTTGTDPEESTQEFLREARIAAAVSHPNIVAIYDAGEENGSPFLIMEWVNGDSLKQEIVSSRRITPERALDVTAELLDGLSAIHAQGIIHRDIKPQNIMVNEFGTIKLTDFGIAQVLTEPDGPADGTTAGSAAYMAPEQAQGLPVTPASDIYAAGVILYEMLTGRLPFRSDDPQQVLLQHINDPVPRPRRTNPSIPTQVEAIVLKALEKDPDDRFESAEEMRQALLIARTHLPVRRPVPVPIPESPESRFPLQRLAWAAASIALIVVAIAGATSLAVLDFGTSPTAAESSDDQAEVSEAPSEPEPVVTSEPTVPEQASPGGPPDPPYSVYENGSRIRGEVVVDAPSESDERVNRPAPNRPATDDEMNEESEDTTAQTQQPAAPPPPPPPTPTPVPQVEPEPTATPKPVPTEPPSDDDQSDDDSEAPGNSGDNPGQGSGNGNGNQGSGNGEGQDNGSSDDDDPPASGQGQNDDDDESADPQSSDDDDADDERDDSDSLVASDNSSSDDASDDDEVADLNDSSSSEQDNSNASTDDDDAANDDDDADLNSTGSSSSDDEDASVEDDDDAADDDDASDRDDSGSRSSDDDDADLNSTGSSSTDDEDATVEDDDDATEDEDSDEAERQDAADSEKKNGAGSSDKKDDDDKKTQDRDDRVENSDDDDEEKKTRKPSRTDRIFERFADRFSIESAA